MPPPPAILLQSVVAGYPGTPVLRGLDLTVPPGGMVAVLGPNGTGKTTLFRALTGLVPCPQGRIFLFGHDLRTLSAPERAALVAVVPQSVECPLPFTVADMVLMGRTSRGGSALAPAAGDLAAAEAAMAETDVLRLRNRAFSALSGGEQQRTLIAMALAQNPRLLLLDEATAHLDIRHRLDILEILARRNRETGLTVLMTTHDWELAAIFFPRLLLLDDGRIAADGSPEQVLAGPEPARVFRCGFRMLRDTDSGGIAMLPLRRTASAPGETP